VRAGRAALPALLLLLLTPLAPAAPARAQAPEEQVRQGAALLHAGRAEEAADLFQAALDAQPASEAARLGLARAWAAQAAALLRQGRLREGRELLERAADLVPDDAEYRLALATALFRERDLRAARREVDRALEIVPASPAARELSGDLYYEEGRLNLASGEWQAAAQAAPSPGLAAKLDRARLEMGAEESFGRESTRHFAIRYDGPIPRPVIEGIGAALDEAFETLHDRLGESPRDDIQVILYSRVAFGDISQAPNWAGGSYDGKIRIPVGGLTNPHEAAALLPILKHELTHAFLHRFAPEGIPLWFNEGLATVFQGATAELARERLAGRPAPRPATLAEVERGLHGGGDVTAAYLAAALAVLEVIDARGFRAVRGIVDGVGAGRPFDEVFQDEVRLDLQEFQERWRRGLP
jgi:tetratricopeptide (TPR) repeat protein